MELPTECGGRAASTPQSLPLLQNSLKRDPPAYFGEFQLQFERLRGLLAVMEQQPQRPVKDLRQLLMFLAHTSPCYSPKVSETPLKTREKKDMTQNDRSGDSPGAFLPLSTSFAFDEDVEKKGVEDRHYSAELAASIQRILTQLSSSLHPQTRQSLLLSLLLLRRKQQLSCLDLLRVSVQLLQANDKSCRQTLFSFVTRDVSKLCLADRMQQSFARLSPELFAMLARPACPLAARLALCCLIQVYRQQRHSGGLSIHQNSKNFKKIVNAAAACTLAGDTKLATSAALFLLGELQSASSHIANVEDNESDDEEDAAVEAEAKRLTRSQEGVSKKTASAKKKLKRAKAKLQRQVARKQQRAEQQQLLGGVVASASIIDLLFDPQGLAEKLFGRVKGQSDRFSSRLIFLNLLSRLIGHHKLLLFNFYPFIQKYLQPHQRLVSSLLAILATAVHELVPPQELLPIVKHIADVFINETRGEEVITVGINAITEICSRAPLCMTKDLLSDLVEYRRERRSKSVVMAARRLMNLYRDVLPAMLPPNARGKDAAMAVRNNEEESFSFGQFKPAENLTGLDELEKLQKLVKARKRMREEEEEEEDEEEEEEEEDGDEEEGDEEEEEEEDEEDGDEEEEEEEDEDGDEEDEEEEDEEDEDEEEDEDHPKKMRRVCPTVKGEGSSSEAVASSSLAMDRILTPEEFHALRVLQAKSVVETGGARKGSKKQEGEEEQERLLSLLAKTGGVEAGVDASDEDGSDLSSDEELEAEADSMFVSSTELEGLAGRKRRQARERNRLKEEAKMERKRAGKSAPWPFARKQREAAEASLAADPSKRHKTVVTGNAPQKLKARNKPLAMVRQSRKLRDKKQQSVKQKLQNLKKQIKNLKKSQVGRPRRRKR
ncbi:hypothetical protein TGME49_294430 [Toxoplasma gondii ME49]|uniref:Protein SDA1 n=2 Tax=Toxoplasma gondii TaxID=5811 RepID=A0A125YY37_TOXGV|nr:hypothetical protein TGME49_294430 [Toxoplasma gondii ME49]EPT32589.1 hypothetical protein TGME49_294430 [Toxoplasma gondii ME49]ESS29319.1 SDA1-like protein [Toxoplasma gondii VEG]CEL71503.1 TPA: new= Protein SDA1 homolog [Toxoplasma gondii VEG]|eukprot:XP_018638588.1 hypothetical protein TGME49_294430 [Toxoplasma gondii ME49]